MNNEIHHNRYTLNLIDEDNKIISLGASTLEEIDRLTTNFTDKKMLLDYINENFNFDSKMKDIIITYHVNEIIKKAKMIFSDKRDILIKNSLIDDIGVFLNNFENVKNLILENADNKHRMHYLEELVYVRGNIDKYNFTIGKIKNKMHKEYKLKRDFALIIENHYEKLGNHFLRPYPIYKLNEDEIKNLFAKMNLISFKTSFTETSDDLLNTLIANNEYDEISSLYSNEDLNSLGAKSTFDGSNDFEGKSRSR